MGETKLRWFKAHDSWGESFKLMPPEDLKPLVLAIWDYAMSDGKTQPENLPGIASILWPMIKSEIGKDILNRANGKKGGNPNYTRDERGGSPGSTGDEGGFNPGSTGVIQNQNHISEPELTPEQEQEPEPAHTPEGTLRERWEKFWSLYPRKEGEEDAQGRFFRLNPDEPTFLLMMEALARQKHSEQWREQDGRYVPRAYKWLSDGSWQNDAYQPIKYSGNPDYGGDLF